jgi:tricarballylate dehydrogenase
MRGGNTRHTRNIRCAHDAGDAYVTGGYPIDEVIHDLGTVGTGPVNPALARLAVIESQTIPEWMAAHGVRWQPPLRGTLSLSRTNRFFLGGGTALVNQYYRAMERAGIEVRYGTRVVDLVLNGKDATAVVIESPSRPVRVAARAIVVASGGFEANIPWLKTYWGAAADNYIIRGTPYNDGMMLARLQELGAQTAGEAKGFHAIGVDARSPKFDGGIATRLDATPFSIVVNAHARRFADEGADIWPKRYASWGRLIAEQPDQIAYAVGDSTAKKLFIPSLYPAYEANTIPDLARTVGLNPDVLAATVEEYNRAIIPGVPFTPEALDGAGTRGLVPPKSNWALPIARPPFYLYPMRPGITFTYLGVAVDERARVLDTSGAPFGKLFAAGEVMSGNTCSDGSLAGRRLSLPLTDLIGEANRQLTICNACRYCEGYCAVFPALELRTTFATSDVMHLANLCHDCRACYYACPYVPPHEFKLNLPAILAEVRTETYTTYASPKLLARAFATGVPGIVRASIAGGGLILGLIFAFGEPGRLLEAGTEPGSIYRALPYLAMALPFVILAGYAGVVMLLAGLRFWRDTQSELSELVDPGSLLEAARESLGLTYLKGGGGDGCYYPDEEPSSERRWLHMLAFYGFLVDLAATVIAAIEQDFFDLLPPYPILSAPVILGTVGGVALLIGTAGLLRLKWRSDERPAAARMRAWDYGFLVSLNLIAVTGMLVLIFRATPSLGPLIAIHLGTVAALFVSMPYGKFVHFVYRYAALVRNRIEMKRAEPVAS